MHGVDLYVCCAADDLGAWLLHRRQWQIPVLSNHSTRNAITEINMHNMKFCVN